MIKRILLLPLLLLALIPWPVSQAQSPVMAIQSLNVDLWPDYDRPAVLVLLTGALAADTPLPAVVTLPLPANADLNAVARITSDDIMIDDIDSTTGSGQLTFTTSDLRFRVEYYVPYIVENNQHTFTFTWSADLPVDQLVVTVQEPVAASGLVMEPAAINVEDGFNDLTYHTLPAQPVPAGQPYSVRLGYTMASPQLSIENLPGVGQTETSSPLSPSPTSAGFNWPLMIAVAGGVLILLAGAWQIISTRAAAKAASAPAGRSGKRPPARFCHICGQPAGPQDRFCRHCGTAIKGR
jgi:hypothetical protein